MIYNGITIRLTPELSTETAGQRQLQDILKVMKGKNLQPNCSILEESHSDLKEKSKAL